MNQSLWPISFKERVVNAYGSQGARWLDALPDLITTAKSRFTLKTIKTLPYLSFNYIAEVTDRSHNTHILKISPPFTDVKNEIHALQFMSGESMVALHDYDLDNGMLLISVLHPGKMLSTLTDDEKATRIAAQIMQAVWKPIKDNPHAFPTTQDWFKRLDAPIELPSSFPKPYINKARTIADELHQSLGECVLLHGDLHHFNILSHAGEAWIAIDPKGIIGEKEYDVGAFLRNPIPDISTVMNTKQILGKRLEIFSETLRLDKQRLSSWAFAQAVLSSVWCLDAKMHDWTIFFHCAEVLESQL